MGEGTTAMSTYLIIVDKEMFLLLVYYWFDGMCIFTLMYMYNVCITSPCVFFVYVLACTLQLTKQYMTCFGCR